MLNGYLRSSVARSSLGCGCAGRLPSCGCAEQYRPSVPELVAIRRPCRLLIHLLAELSSLVPGRCCLGCVVQAEYCTTLRPLRGEQCCISAHPAAPRWLHASASPPSWRWLLPRRLGRQSHCPPRGCPSRSIQWSRWHALKHACRCCSRGASLMLHRTAPNPSTRTRRHRGRRPAWLLRRSRTQSSCHLSACRLRLVCRSGRRRSHLILHSCNHHHFGRPACAGWVRPRRRQFSPAVPGALAHASRAVPQSWPVRLCQLAVPPLCPRHG